MKYSFCDRLTPPPVTRPFDFGRALDVIALKPRRGEDYAFAVVIEPETEGDAAFTFSPLTCDDCIIPGTSFECINTGGIDHRGNPFTSVVHAAAGEQRILWFTLRVPVSAAEGDYTGFLSLTCGKESAGIPVQAAISGEVCDHGWGEPEKLTRLRWLDSDLGQTGEITRPFTKPVLTDNTVSILGRTVTVGRSGLPSVITSSFTKNIVTGHESRKISSGFSMLIELPGRPVTDTKDFEILSRTTGTFGDGIRFTTRAASDLFETETVCCVEYDGFVSCKTALTAKSPLETDDISLCYTMEPGFDSLFIGLGREGGAAPEKHDFIWDSEKHQNSLWMGGVNGGIRCELHGENFAEPLVNIYYRHRKLRMSESFANPDENGRIRGGIGMVKDSRGAHVRIYSGRRSMKAGKTLHFDFTLLVTPVKEMDMNRRLRTRYYHGGCNPDEAFAAGATHMIVHHASKVNPYINYPFRTDDRFLPVIRRAHELGLGFKPYYTVREQSDKTHEMDALLTLGEELFPHAVGGQGSVLWENEENLRPFVERFGKQLIPAWPTEYDISVIVNGQSRWANYYVEGMKYLCDHLGIDGIYIDDTANDRYTLRRVRRVLDADGRGDCPGDGKDGPRLIDMHTWNHFNGLAGYANCLNLYMTLLPFIDSVWIGESFDHHLKSPEYWMTEIAGTPYGTTSELLVQAADTGAARHRGMLFGITLRLPWSATDNDIWNFIKKYRLEDSELWGFWNDETPVGTGCPDVRASVFVGSEYSVIAAASWADSGRQVKLTLSIDGFDIRDAFIPAIDGYQSASVFEGILDIPKDGGVILVVPRRRQPANDI